MPVNTLQLDAPGAGRHYSARRTVRLSDVLPSGQARLDALARYLQDIASDDGHDAGIDSDLAWVVRKTIAELRRRPRLDEQLDLNTWASGSGARWAARRTTISAAGEPIVEAAALWVCVDVETLRPARLSERFWTMYGEAVEDRPVSSRLTHADPPAALVPGARAWPLRITDFDVLDHVNNAVTWAAVEDELGRLAPGAAIRRAEVEYREAMDRTDGIGIVSQVTAGIVHIWLMAEGAGGAAGAGERAPGTAAAGTAAARNPAAGTVLASAHVELV